MNKIDLSKSKNNIINEINEKYKEIIELIKKRKEDLINNVNETSQDILGKTEIQKNGILSKIKDIKDLKNRYIDYSKYESINDALNSNKKMDASAELISDYETNVNGLDKFIEVCNKYDMPLNIDLVCKLKKIDNCINKYFTMNKDTINTDSDTDEEKKDDISEIGTNQPQNQVCMYIYTVSRIWLCSLTFHIRIYIE